MLGNEAGASALWPHPFGQAVEAASERSSNSQTGKLHKVLLLAGSVSALWQERNSQAPGRAACPRSVLATEQTGEEWETHSGHSQLAEPQEGQLLFIGDAARVTQQGGRPSKVLRSRSAVPLRATSGSVVCSQRAVHLHLFELVAVAEELLHLRASALLQDVQVLLHLALPVHPTTVVCKATEGFY